MYFDNAPCEVCGSEVELRPHDAEQPETGKVGPANGVVGDADSTPDERVCTNPDCPTNRGQ